MATISLAGLQLDPDNQFITTYIANEAVVAGEAVGGDGIASLHAPHRLR